MSVRTDLVLEIQQHLLGPRAGSLEQIADPHKEYITGVLAPIQDGPPPPDIDADADLLEGDADDDLEDEDDVAGIATPSGLAPALDPKSQPQSLGISFVVHSSEVPQIEICATYARYERAAEDRNICQRHAFAHLTGTVEVADGWHGKAPEDVLLQMRCLTLEPGLYRISVFLRNVRRAAGPFPAPEEYLFQPQLRILLGEGCALESIMRSQGDGSDPDEDSLEMLYRNRTALARGHLCSAVWREIDPERPLSNGSASPFTWVDSEAVTGPECLRFALPDLRTEYLPLYPVVAPSAEWRTDFGAEPELRAGVLAQAWTHVELRRALSPLPAAYREWIETLDPVTVPTHLQDAAREHIRLCNVAAQRIEKALLLLEEDEVRLAFCFANQAIYEQNRWRLVREGKAGEFTWRPFQMGFFLLALTGIADHESPDRALCDLLWFPTGGGKTEAYLGLIAFTLALRRLRAPKDRADHRVEAGLGVISRYTLRLLTIQQFRRALGMITACEVLRVQASSGRVGWRPSACPQSDDYLWGATRFAAGLWAGKGVTPNNLASYSFRRADGKIDAVYGALDILRGQRGDGEPAQVLTCPCCDTILAIAQPRHAGQEQQAFPPGKFLHLHLVFHSDNAPPPLDPKRLSTKDIIARSAVVRPLPSPGFYTLSTGLEATGNGFSAWEVDSWWTKVVRPLLGSLVNLECARPSRPGYFIREGRGVRSRSDVAVDFEIYCPNPDCGLAGGNWREKSPIPIQAQAISDDRQDWQEVLPPFQHANDKTIGTRVPIPARTVDEQVYRHPPSLLVATVDKFARLAFAPSAAALFGNITHYEKHLTTSDIRYGYCRGDEGQGLTRRLDWEIPPPDLILQDELHLIDGPLGSMVGLYETAVDALCEHGGGVGPKYIASTATVREAPEQVQALFCRELFQFPPRGLDADDSFFAHTEEVHPSETVGQSGRLYLGVAAPGKGAQTPIVRIWSVLLQAVEEARQRGVPAAEIDPFWTLVGYFNAIRELAGAAGLYRQDIYQRVQFLAGGGPQRDVGREAIELSSRADSLLLPGLLDRLGQKLQDGDAETAALATSMFGTGVDVTRLGLMVVHGQPKSTSSYIQATGRVGRSGGGLVVTFLRASRPRDLDHYEFFTGYHRQLYRSVEPVTVAPFSPRARERGIGPLCTLLLRQARAIQGNPVSDFWRQERSASQMDTHRGDPEVSALCDVFVARAQQQPDGRRPDAQDVRDDTSSELDLWHALARRHGMSLLYYEYALSQIPTSPVVLGDPQHQQNNLEVAFENAPQSLREVEATTGFKV